MVDRGKRAEFLCAKVSCFQLKIYCCRLSYVSLMITKKKICDRYKEDKDKGIKAKTSKPHQITDEDSKRIKGQRNYKAVRKLTKCQGEVLTYQ